MSGEDPRAECRDRGDQERQADRDGDADRRQHFPGLSHVHEHEQAQVVEDGGRTVQHRDDRQPDVPRLHGGAKEIELPDESHGGRNPGQGDHEERESRPDERIAEPHARVVAKLVPSPAFVLQQDHDGEGSQVHRRVGDEVENGAGAPGVPSRDEPDQHIARMSDAGIGQHSLHVRLGDGRDIPHRHCERGDHREEHVPVAVDGTERDEERAQEGGERRGLGPCGHEGGNGCGRPFVHVGGPHVERHESHLEGEPDQDHGHAGQEEACREGTLRVGEGVGDPAQVGRAGRAVGERDPVEQYRRGERSQQEILHRRLVRGFGVAAVTGQDVERDREDLDAEKERDQIEGLREEHHARGAEEDQRVILPLLHVLRAEEGL